jgi:hypothetical protein
MIYVVNIMGPSGGKATKEYEATSMRVAVRLAELEPAIILNAKSLTYG